jgi:hypothetical protein
MILRQHLSAAKFIVKTATILCLLLVQSSDAFSMQEYRPPVKTSVKKIHSDRSSALIHGDATSIGTHHRSAGMRTEQQQKRRDGETNRHSPPSRYRRRFLTTSKAAHAAGVTLPQPSSFGDSFERRMRDLVLGRQREEAQQQQPTQYQEQQQVVVETVEKGRPKGTPSNVKVINSLQDFKEIVGDEQEKPVIVRFFATYCKVGYTE